MSKIDNSFENEANKIEVTAENYEELAAGI